MFHSSITLAVRSRLSLYVAGRRYKDLENPSLIRHSGGVNNTINRTRRTPPRLSQTTAMPSCAALSPLDRPERGPDEADLASFGLPTLTNVGTPAPNGYSGLHLVQAIVAPPPPC